MRISVLLRKNILLVLFVLSVPTALMAQKDKLTKTKDSLPVANTTALFEKEYRFFNDEPTLLQQSTIKYYNNVSLAYNSQSGPLHLSQQADKIIGFNFNTFGTKKTGRFLLSGSFDYTIKNIDSLGNTLDYKPNDINLTSYYFFAIKKGNWIYTNYHLKGVISTGLLHDKILASVGLDYNNSSADRSNDPRPSKTTFHAAATPVLGWRINSKQSIQAGIIVGYDKNDLNVTYKNDAYQLSSLYPDYTNYLVMGYGFYRTWVSNLTIRTTANNYGFTGSYSGDFKWGKVALSAYWKSDQQEAFKSITTTVESQINYGKQNDDIRGGKFWWSLDKKNLQYRLQADYYSVETRNYTYLLAGSNYLATYDNIKIEPSLGIQKNGKQKDEIILKAQYHSLFRTDGNANITTANKWYVVSLKNNYYFNLPQSATLRLALQGGYRFAGTSQIIVPDLQATLFSKQVIYPDFNYYQTNTFYAGGGVRYNFPTKKQNISLNGNVLVENALHETFVNGTAYPKRTRANIDLGIAVAF